MKQSLFQRIRNIVMADLHSTLDEKERQNPIALLNQYLRDGEQEIKKIEQLIERHGMLKTSFLREKEQAVYMAEKRKQQVDIARQAGAADLEARAWKEAEYYEGQAARLADAHTKTAEQVEELQHQLTEMKNKLKEMQTKRMELMARENMAHANRRIHDTIGKMSKDNPFIRFEEIEEHMRDMEIRVHEAYERDTFDYRIAKLEKELKESAHS